MYVKQFKINGEWVNAIELEERDVLQCDARCGKPVIPGTQVSFRLENCRGISNRDPGYMFIIHEDCLVEFLDIISPRREGIE